MNKNMSTIRAASSIRSAMYKSELARQAGVSRETLRWWCRDSESELAGYGYTRHSHILSPGAVDLLCRKYGIRIEDV